MKLYFIQLLKIVLFSGLVSTSCAQSSRSIDDAQNAYFQMDHKKAYATFANVMRDRQQTIDDRIIATFYTAKMQWMFYQNPDSAFLLIAKGLELNEDQAKFHLLRARILNEQGKYDEAMQAATLASASGESEKDFYDAEFAFCYSILEKHKSLASTNNQAFNPEHQQLLEGYSRLKKLADPRPGDVAIAKLQIGYALLVGSGEDLFNGWMSYFRLTRIDQVHPSLIEQIDEFQEAAKSYSSTSTLKTKEAVLLGLAESGFYEYAALVHSLYFDKNPSSDQDIKEILLYHQFIESIQSMTLAFYQEIIANGERSNNERKEIYVNQLVPYAMKLWKALEWNSGQPTFTKEGFERELRKRFKAIISPFSANGYFGLQMGHIVLNDKRSIKQYGEEAVFSYIAVDHMVSNGYSGWFWDGLAQTGGWADDEGFLQVRSAYTSGPVNKWVKQTDSVQIKEWKEDIEKYSLKDDSIAQENPYAFLRGLSLRLDRLQEQSLLDSLKSSGLIVAELRIAFINTIEFLDLESGIYAHEGRHVIDKKNNYSKKSAKLEYTAKLSEIYFSSKPMMAVSAVISRNIGDDTSHGKANLKVVKGLVDWMEKNSKEIVDYDAARPTLPQLDKLSDSQLKRAVKSLDPMAD
ncbi:MAG: hypothetical protein ABJG47_12980 [Ekhidna sp.]